MFFDSKLLKSTFTVFLVYILEKFILNLIFVFLDGSILAYPISFLILLLTLFTVYRKELLIHISNFRNDFRNNYLKCITIFVICTILINSFTLFFSTFYGIMPSNEMSNRELIMSSPVMLSFVMIFLIPVVEELIFRFPFVSSSNKKIAFVIYTCLFAFVHVLSANSTAELIYIINYLILSFEFGYCFYKTNNIFMSTIVHMLNNLVAIVLLFI